MKTNSAEAIPDCTPNAGKKVDVWQKYKYKHSRTTPKENTKIMKSQTTDSK